MNTSFALLAQFEKPVLGVKELASLFGISPRTVENKIVRGEFEVKTFLMGSKPAAHIADVASYIDKQRGLQVE